MIILVLPFPPSVNHYWMQNGNTRYIGVKGKAFRNSVVAAVLPKRIKTLSGRVKMEIEAYPPDHRRRDIDNLLKALLDAIQHAGVYADDNQIDILHICRKEVIKGGKLLVRISEIGLSIE